MNFRKLCRIACVFSLLMFFQGNALAATIHGTVYEWNSFKPLDNTVVEINSTPEQYFVATNAEYSFNLTPGTYLITANYSEENTTIYTAQEEVVISDKGEYVHDLLLFPTYQEELLGSSGFEVPDLTFGETESVPQKSYQTTLFISAFLAFIVVLLVSYLLKKGHRKSPEIVTHFPGKNEEPKALQAGNPIKDAEFYEEIEADVVENPVETIDTGPSIDTSPASSEAIGEKAEGSAEEENVLRQIKPQEPDRWHFPFSSKESHKSNPNVQKNSRITLPEDLKDLLDMIRNSGNRITQREIRKKSPYSESKVSLMLSDLEERGLIEKFKRGRGNIIRIPDRYVHRQKEHENKKE